MDELENMFAFEIEIFYYMTLDRIKKEKKAIDDAKKGKGV